jgi:hypothetical protein
MDVEHLGSIPTSLSAAEQRALIDERLATFERTAHLLRHKRNALAPISRLPLEVFTKIIMSIPSAPRKQALRSLQSSLARDGTMAPPWVAVSHVCAAWRALVFTSQVLATHIDMTYGAHYTSTMLDRAAGAPLALRMTRNIAPAMSAFLNFLAPRRAQVAQLTVSCSASHEPMLNALMYAHEAAETLPHLVSLELIGQRGVAYSFSVALSSVLLPELRHLVLYNVVLNSRFPYQLLDRLSSLECTYDVSHVGSVSIPLLLRNITRARNLHCLRLRLADRTNDSESGESVDIIPQSVVLPLLRTLEIEAAGQLFTTCVAAFVATSATSATLQCRSWPGSSADVEQVFKAIPVATLPLDRLSVRTTSDRSRFDWSSSSFPGQLSLVLKDRVQDSMMMIMNVVLRQSHVTSLHICAAYPAFDSSDVGQWQYLFLQHLTPLTHLSLADDAGRLLHEVLDDYSLLPNLVSLSFSDPDFGALARTLVHWLDQRFAWAGQEVVPSRIVIQHYDRAYDGGELGEEDLKLLFLALLSYYRGEDFVLVWDWVRIHSLRNPEAL